MKEGWLDDIFQNFEIEDEPISAYELNPIEKLNRFLIEVSY